MRVRALRRDRRPPAWGGARQRAPPPHVRAVGAAPRADAARAGGRAAAHRRVQGSALRGGRGVPRAGAAARVGDPRADDGRLVRAEARRPADPHEQHGARPHRDGPQGPRLLLERLPWDRVRPRAGGRDGDARPRRRGVPEAQGDAAVAVVCVGAAPLPAAPRPLRRPDAGEHPHAPRRVAPRYPVRPRAPLARRRVRQLHAVARSMSRPR